MRRGRGRGHQPAVGQTGQSPAVRSSGPPPSPFPTSNTHAPARTGTAWPSTRQKWQPRWRRWCVRLGPRAAPRSGCPSCRVRSRQRGWQEHAAGGQALLWPADARLHDSPASRDWRPGGGPQLHRHRLQQRWGRCTAAVPLVALRSTQSGTLAVRAAPTQARLLAIGALPAAAAPRRPCLQATPRPTSSGSSPSWRV